MSADRDAATWDENTGKITPKMYTGFGGDNYFSMTRVILIITLARGDLQTATTCARPCPADTPIRHVWCICVYRVFNDFPYRLWIRPEVDERSRKSISQPFREEALLIRTRNGDFSRTIMVSMQNRKISLCTWLFPRNPRFFMSHGFWHVRTLRRQTSKT